MTEKTQLYSLSISARATLDMHSLNNEGGEGNQIQTRMVNIVDEGGVLHNVNAISGDMYKHIQAQHLFHLAREASNLPLCAGCQEFNANRINADDDFFARNADTNDAEMLDEMLRACMIDDIEGILITAGKRSLPRKSVIEFGWVVGIPAMVETDSYFHVKYVASDRTKTAESREAEGQTGANLGQSIFHRPASSGVYAIVCHVEFARIGYNDITQTYAIDLEKRARRAKALLESIAYTFLQPDGAMRSAQAPHLVNLEGVVTMSTGPVPAPTVSPIKSNYLEDIERTHAALERFRPGMVYRTEFGSLGHFTDLFGNIIDESMPYEIQHQ